MQCAGKFSVAEKFIFDLRSKILSTRECVGRNMIFLKKISGPTCFLRSKHAADKILANILLLKAFSGPISSNNLF